MAFLKTPSTQDAAATVRGNGVFLRLPVLADYPAWAELRARSREHLTPFEPQWSGDELSRSAFRRRVHHYQREAREDLGYAFFIFRDDDSALLGGMTLSNVRRGVTQAVTLGYWVGAPHAGSGVMSEAVHTIIPFVFDALRLHRMEAACLTHNAASIKVLDRNGFRREGLARDYLKINGAWQDHILFALLEDDRHP